jgi:hypothetical protein
MDYVRTIVGTKSTHIVLPVPNERQIYGALVWKNKRWTMLREIKKYKSLAFFLTDVAGSRVFSSALRFSFSLTFNTIFLEI